MRKKPLSKNAEGSGFFAGNMIFNKKFSFGACFSVYYMIKYSHEGALLTFQNLRRVSQ